MAEPFYGEIRLFSFPFAPRGWAFCDGTFLPVAQNQALFSLIGTTYGSPGAGYFTLPDLRGQLPIHNHNTMGQLQFGEYSHMLRNDEVPGHAHTMYASSRSDNLTSSPQNYQFASGAQIYSTGGAAPQKLQLSANSVTGAGGVAHENRQPYCVVNFCIALRGLFPSRP